MRLFICLVWHKLFPELIFYNFNEKHRKIAKLPWHHNLDLWIHRGRGCCCNLHCRCLYCCCLHCCRIEGQNQYVMLLYQLLSSWLAHLVSYWLSCHCTRCLCLRCLSLCCCCLHFSCLYCHCLNFLFSLPLSCWRTKSIRCYIATLILIGTPGVPVTPLHWQSLANQIVCDGRLIFQLQWNSDINAMIVICHWAALDMLLCRKILTS